MMNPVTPSSELARLTVEALERAGVTHVVLCPGSRSAPLAYELAEHAPATIRLLIRHDERVAGFTALGVSRSGLGLGAVLTTSGTAVANLHPAVLEASHGNVPLIVLSADRPPALRGTWANQTSEHQRTLFGEAVRSNLDLDDLRAQAAPDVAWQALLATLQSALGVTGDDPPGPVQLNLGFSDPLVPDAAAAQAEPEARRPGVVARRRRQPPSSDELQPGPNTVVVAGDGAGWRARWLAEAGGWPLLAEPSSGARGGPNAVAAYRLLLELDEFAAPIERVVAFGRPTLSRPVTALLARPDAELVIASAYPSWPAPGRAATRVSINVSPSGLGERGRGWFLADPDPWLARWRDASHAAQQALDVALPAEDGLSLNGPLVATLVWAAAREGEPLVVASSNAVRDLDLAARPRDVPGSETVGPNWLVAANRGLAGIDGTISTATGVALAAGRPSRLLIGDLAFLHDVNALLAEPGAARPDLQIVVLNDGGGGIFSLLEHGARAVESPERESTFERVFGTPHGADLGLVCAGFGVPHQLVKDAAGLRSALDSPEPGTTVLEVRTDRGGLRDLHARLRTAVHAAVARGERGGEG
jgi:2-succinyl-5-enolpyruvyl-6-hydroxy-3-cyclohexene-1-carboxylate synthase